MTTFDDVEVTTITDAEAKELVARALEDCGCTWGELQEQAKTGRFSSELARRAWFVIHDFAEPAA